MPPSAKESLGWKAFFALLAILQVIGIGALWRTVDSLSYLTEISNRNDIRIREVILPKLLEHDQQIDRLQSR